MDVSIILPAFVAGLAVLLSHIPLGREVLSRGIIFIDLAVAQFAGLGIIFASTLGFATHGGITIQLFALGGALTGALLLSATEKILKQHQEAGIGCLFVLSATASILLLAKNPHGGEQLQNILVGQILWVEWHQITLPLITGLLIAILYFRKSILFKNHGFYIVFAVAITQSVQLIGVYLVFATLIIPALSTIRLRRKITSISWSLVIGLLAYALGLHLSSLFDLPSGAMIVWMLALLGFLFSAFYNDEKERK